MSCDPLKRIGENCEVGGPRLAAVACQAKLFSARSECSVLSVALRFPYRVLTKWSPASCASFNKKQKVCKMRVIWKFRVIRPVTGWYIAAKL